MQRWTNVCICINGMDYKNKARQYIIDRYHIGTQILLIWKDQKDCYGNKLTSGHIFEERNKALTAIDKEPSEATKNKKIPQNVKDHKNLREWKNIVQRNPYGITIRLVDK